jgi:hypothetical protein
VHRAGTGTVPDLGGGQRAGLATDAEAYLLLPHIAKLATFQERAMQIRTFANHFGDRDRLTITKQELERLLGQWQKENNWKAGTFNNWVTCLKSFYSSLEDPEGRSPNYARKIEYSPLPEAMPRNVDYRVLARVLARLTPSEDRRSRIGFNDDQEARRLAAEGVPNTQIAQKLGVSETAIRKLLARPALRQSREAERRRLALRLMAFAASPLSNQGAQARGFGAA